MPKPLLPVAGTPILHRTLRCLAKAGVRDVVVVVGHGQNKVVSSVSEALSSIGDGTCGLAVTYVVSDRYESTNNLYSLWLAREELDQDLYLLDGDIVFDEELLQALEGSDESLAAVLPYEPGMTGTVVELDSENCVLAIADVRDDKLPFSRPYKTASLFLLRQALLREQFLPTLARFISDGRVGEFYEAALAKVVEGGQCRLRAVDCSRFRWQEIDDTNDLMTADYVFSTPDERFTLLSHAYGGFRRYGSVDHLMMTNVYFPPSSLRGDLRRELDRVVTDYPAGQRTLAKLMGGIVDQPEDRLVVANGASELIKAISGLVSRGALVPVPTFNEYEHAFQPDQLVRFELPPPEFRLDTDAFYRAAEKSEVELAVVVSPNNPTSLLVPRNELLRVCERLAVRGVFLIVDESYVDFCADPVGQTLAGEVDAHPNLAIVKSLTQSCGIPGLRVGYLLTANAALAARVRDQLPIWNVNGVAEAFLRLLPQYKAALKDSCRRVRRNCDELYSLLKMIPGVEVQPPDAHFCLVRLPEGARATEVARRLFVDHDILAKDCSGKSMRDAHGYLRVVSRTLTENERFASALVDALEADAGQRDPAAGSVRAG